MKKIMILICALAGLLALSYINRIYNDKFNTLVNQIHILKEDNQSLKTRVYDLSNNSFYGNYYGESINVNKPKIIDSLTLLNDYTFYYYSAYESGNYVYGTYSVKNNIIFLTSNFIMNNECNSFRKIKLTRSYYINDDGSISLNDDNFKIGFVKSLSKSNKDLNGKNEVMNALITRENNCRK